MEIDYVLVLDDSCQVQLHCKGHVDEDEFRSACEKFYLQNFEKHVEANLVKVKHTHWRSVRATGDCIVSDRQLVESKKGLGAFPVTLLDKFLPI